MHGRLSTISRSGPWLPGIHYCLADVQREVQLGVHEDLGRVLVAEVGVRQVLLAELHHGPGAACGHGLAFLAPVTVPAEDDAAEYRGRRVVQVHGRAPGSDQGRDGALDQFLARLGQHGDRDVVRHRARLDQVADEVEVGLARGREADLDLLVAHRDQQIEHGLLAGGVHRVDQRLIAVAQVGRQPARGGCDRPARPAPVGQVDGREPAVTMARHAGRGLRIH